MDNKLKKMAKAIVKIDDKTRSKPQPYDTSGVVQRVKDGVAYIKFQGAEDETPVDMTINCKPGDNVKVRISNRRAWVTGNATAPPTDDKQAYVAQAQAVQAENKAAVAETEAKVAQETANVAEKEATNAASTAETARQISYDTAQYFWNKSEDGTAEIPTGAYITEIPKDQFTDPDDEQHFCKKGNLLARSEGVYIRKGSTILSSFEATATTIGQANDNHILIDSESFKFKEGTTTTANFEVFNEQINVGGATLPTYILVDGLHITSENNCKLFLSTYGDNVAYLAGGNTRIVLYDGSLRTGDIIMNGHTSSIGDVQNDNNIVENMASGTTLVTTGATVHLGRGTWIISYHVDFQTSSSAGYRQMLLYEKPYNPGPGTYSAVPYSRIRIAAGSSIQQHLGMSIPINITYPYGADYAVYASQNSGSAMDVQGAIMAARIS